MKFISNTYDPKEKDAPRHVTRELDETQEEAWRRYLKWLEGKTIGEPQATSTYTVKQLKEMKMVGVYIV